MIDWGFISSPWIEGYSLKGTVPDPTGSNSGVTVASGCDLGQMSQADLAAFPADLAALLRPFVGLRGAQAQIALLAHGLTLTPAQAGLLMAWEGRRMSALLATHFPRFNGLPDACQTVLASVTWQYGTPWVRCPHFWGHAVNGDWAAVVADLQNFGDRYPARHAREAQYLLGAGIGHA